MGTKIVIEDKKNSDLDHLDAREGGTLLEKIDPQHLAGRAGYRGVLAANNRLVSFEPQDNREAAREFASIDDLVQLKEAKCVSEHVLSEYQNLVQAFAEADVAYTALSSYAVPENETRLTREHVGAVVGSTWQGATLAGAAVGTVFATGYLISGVKAPTFEVIEFIGGFTFLFGAAGVSMTGVAGALFYAQDSVLSHRKRKRMLSARDELVDALITAEKTSSDALFYFNEVSSTESEPPKSTQNVREPWYRFENTCEFLQEAETGIYLPPLAHNGAEWAERRQIEIDKNLFVVPN